MKQTYLDCRPFVVPGLQNRDLAEAHKKGACAGVSISFRWMRHDVAEASGNDGYLLSCGLGIVKVNMLNTHLIMSRHTFEHFQTPRRELKIRRQAKHF